MNSTKPAGANPATIGRILTQNPDLYSTLVIANTLRNDYAAGSLEVPKIIDLADYKTPEDAELVAAFALAVIRG